MPVTDQQCSSLGCMHPAAFRTRTKPAWCAKCIDAKLAKVHLLAAEPFPGRVKDWWLLTCRRCDTTAHYRLEQVLGNAVADITACDACRWSIWANESRAMGGILGAPLTREDFETTLDAHHFDLVKILTPRMSANDPILTRCRTCARLSAHRLADATFGCTCTRNTRSTNPGAKASSGRQLFADSDSPARDWWDEQANDPQVLRTITLKARRTVHWVCPQCSHRFAEKMYEMSQRPTCPQCREREHREWLALLARYDRTPVLDVPELALAWNDPRDPRALTVGAAGFTKLRCPEGHQPRVDAVRYLAAGCPSCRAADTRTNNRQLLADVQPELAAQWHPTRNGTLTPADLVWDSRRTVWWHAECCGHDWQDTPRDRDKYQRLRCPECRTILGSLGWVDPGLALEWSQENPLSPWQVRPKSDPGFTPWWICSTDPDHRWQMNLASRSTGSGCPECRERGKSRVEKDHFAAARKVFGAARSGALLRSPDFTTRESWTADILFLHDSRPVVVEYDGAYWHASESKQLVDDRKTRDLLAAGHLVVRLREDDLVFLDIDDPRLFQLRVDSAAPRPVPVMEQIREWLEQAPGQDPSAGVVPPQPTRHASPAAGADRAGRTGFAHPSAPSRLPARPDPNVPDEPAEPGEVPGGGAVISLGEWRTRRR